MTLALKYRPKRLEDLVGQSHVTLVLQAMLERWRNDESTGLAPALLLTGPRGSGKTSTARIIAAYLNCESVKDRDAILPDGVCNDCRAIESGSSISVTEVDAASGGSVEAIRHLATLARLMHPGRYRVFIIDEVHAASKEGFSAFLKQLEEPPPDVMYILVTTESQAVPLTIKSRCLSFQFTSLSPDDLIGRLWHVCAQEHLVNNPVGPIAKRAQGSMRDALNYLEHLVALGDLSAEAVERLWPDKLQEFGQDFLYTAIQGNVSGALEVIRETFTVHRDAGAMVDAVIASLCKESDLYQKTQSGRLPPSMIATMMKLCWELRLHGISKEDPIMVEAMWHLFAKLLADRPVRASAPVFNPSDTPEKTQREVEEVIKAAREEGGPDFSALARELR